MPQWAGSCWYYLRYIDPHNDEVFADPEKLKYWLPVDVYTVEQNMPFFTCYMLDSGTKFFMI